MNLPPLELSLKRIVVKGQTALALSTTFVPGSVEGLQLVKASRGAGWFFHAGRISPWTTKGIFEESGRLVVWGDLSDVPEGESPRSWPQEGESAVSFHRAFARAWTARAQQAEALLGFTPSAILPFQTADGWAFAFPPTELRRLLDSLQPAQERQEWEPLRHPDWTGLASWAFTTAALEIDRLTGTLPWVQADEAHLHQEIRELPKTLVREELPGGLDPATRELFFESLTGRGGTSVQWQAWAADQSAPAEIQEDPQHGHRQALAQARRQRRRLQGAFWRRRGTVITIGGAVFLAVLVVVGSVVWGLVKPDPTDTWTPEQVVKGYYAAIDLLDDQQLGKLTAFDASKQPFLQGDKDEVTNRYVIRQVRTAYEQKSPVLEAGTWEAAGKPSLILGQMLWGLTDFQAEGSQDQWTARYQKWIGDGGDQKSLPKAIGVAAVDHLVLVKTSRGWKISSLIRQTQPLP